MFTPATIKAIQDIMRQDIGVDGDATRLSQMVWLIYLKILDDEDKALEIRKEKFVPTLPKKYQWRTWAAPLDGITGDKLIDFVNNDLLPTLRELPENGNQRTDLTRMAFQDVYNFMRKGTLLKQVINKINEIDFNASKDRHAFNEIYERLLKSLQSAGNFGEMYTPRAVTQFIVEMVDPKVGESVLDPAVGTGGFLVHALEHMRKQVKSVKDEQKIQQNIHGVEKKPLPFMLLITNMMLHGIEEPVTMRRGNTLEKPIRDYTDADKVDCIVTNPPFGGTEEPGIESNFPKEFQTRATEDLFLVLIVRLLKKNGRAGIVLPDGTLFGEGMKTSLKKLLLEECNLHTIIRLPKNVFAPYTSINTNLLFFTKGTPTKEVWYYEHPYPTGQTSYSTSDPITLKEFDAEKKWWENRVENERAWKVSYEEIKARGYNLDIKNPRTIIESSKTPKDLLNLFWKKNKEIDGIVREIREVLKNTLNLTSKDSDEINFILNNLEDFIRIPGGVERLSDTVLSFAVAGKLVQQDPNDENAEKLYKKVKEARLRLIENNNGRKKKVKESLEINQEEIPFVIPKSWIWVKLEELCDIQTGKKDANQGSENGEYRFYTCAQVPIKSKTYSFEGESLILPGNGANVGHVFYVNEKFEAYQRTYVLNNFKFINVEYIFNAFQALWRSGMGKQYGGAINFIKIGNLTNFLIPLPPFVEQKRIVKKVEEVMTLINRLKQVIGGK